RRGLIELRRQHRVVVDHAACERERGLVARLRECKLSGRDLGGAGVARRDDERPILAVRDDGRARRPAEDERGEDECEQDEAAHGCLPPWAISRPRYPQPSAIHLGAPLAGTYPTMPR